MKKAILILFIMFLLFMQKDCLAIKPWNSSNLVSGAPGNGNVLANTNNQRHDWYVCADANWTYESQTCENVLLFQVTGNDAEINVVGCVEPIGTIAARTYTASSNTMSSSPFPVYSDATYGIFNFMPIRNAGESFFRVYFSRTTRAVNCAVGTGIYMIKSTDLTASSWSAPVLVIAGAGNTEFGGTIRTVDDNLAIVVFQDANNANRTAFYESDDNGETFSLYSLLPAPASSALGQFVNEVNGPRVLGVLRSVGLLTMITSSDYGQTWASMTNTNIGTAGAQTNVSPHMTLSAGHRDHVTVSFYSRVINRFLVSSPTAFDDAFAGNFTATYLMGTGSDGNGGMFAIDAALHRYIISTDTSASPNAMNWWVGKDIEQTTAPSGKVDISGKVRFN